LEVGEEDRPWPRPKNWLESEEAKAVLLGLGLGLGRLGLIVEKVEPWKKLSVISITLSLSLGGRSC